MIFLQYHKHSGSRGRFGQIVCQVTGRLVDAEAGDVTTDVITLEEAKQKAEEVKSSGVYWDIPAEAELIAIRAVSYIPNRYTWQEEVQSFPVWEFDFAEAGSEWIHQLCVNRLTGEVFDPSERSYSKMEGM